ncbi:MAG: M48 family metallopeptidase [Alphaproteobacteria bacterium]|nr:M48 family metallopeptidase [Alphaproteobacteria bacterium]MBL6939405.1 M48 family metallopeptidase [Alphaproteobacteria bacterium]MBL7097114.1 M48 family metallopeptidase [Alphaproteobacteria bacterium]
MAKFLPLLAALVFAFFALSAPAAAQQSGPAAAPTATIDRHELPPIGTPQGAFDPQKATAAYLAQVSGTARERSDAYFEGHDEVLPFVDALYMIAICGLVLWFRVSAALRDFAVRQTRSRFWQASLYVGPMILILAVATFPLTLYESFFREKSYGLMNQTFLAWFKDQLIGLGLLLIIGLIALTILYAIIRRAPRTWWVWCAAVAIGFSAFGTMIEPVVIAPLFNHYSPLPESPLKTDILRIARGEGIPADNVYLVDASRQSDRISANVSGFMGTTRVTLNDNLLHKGTHDEVLAVLGHEMGHYVLDHALWGLVLGGLVIVLTFGFLQGAFGGLANLFGGNWDVREVSDPAGFPLLVALFTAFSLLMTPVNNWITRSAAIQADMFGINAVRKPDAFSSVVLKLANYRKLDPSPWEEFIFYDHPSGHTRIWEMMRWKAQHLDDPDIKAGPVSPQ